MNKRECENWERAVKALRDALKFVDGSPATSNLRREIEEALILPDIIGVYRRGPKDNDRYTVVLDPKQGWAANPGFYACLGFNECPTDPAAGVSQFSECTLGRHLGKKIKFSDLPDDLQVHVLLRLQPEWED